MASSTKLRGTLELQAEPELTRILAASNTSIMSRDGTPRTEKLMVVGTLSASSWFSSKVGKTRRSAVNS